MFIKLGKVKHVLLALLVSVGVPLTLLSEGHEDNNQQGQWGNGGNPTPTPGASPSATPSATPGGSATPTPGGSATPTPSPNPLTSGPPADETSPDNRFVTVELQTEHPQYTNRGYQATDLSVNSLIRYSARLATFRGFYTGSNRGSGSNPPSTTPITTQLTQAATPAPTPTPSPGQKVRKKKTAKQFTDEGNDNNVEQHGQH
jgi:hypothetical protein